MAGISGGFDGGNQVAGQPLRLLPGVSQILGSVEELLARITDLRHPVQQPVHVLLAELLQTHRHWVLLPQTQLPVPFASKPRAPAPLIATCPAAQGPGSDPHPRGRTPPLAPPCAAPAA